MVIGVFTDDYGARYEVTDRTWLQLPYGRYHVIRWNVGGQFLIAQNDSGNRNAPGRFTRIDWIALPNMDPYTWAFCYASYDASTAEAATAADSVVRRETPRTGCNGHPFSRMRRVPP